MKFLNRLFGRDDERDDVSDTTARRYRQDNAARTRGAADRELSEDERAVERYRYLLRTAPPETIEEAHAEAFAQLTPEQRRMVLAELTRELPERERAAVDAEAEDPRALARMATRAEMRRPGTLERTFSGAGGPGMGYGFGGGGIGLGGLMAGSFLSTIAGVVVGSAIADAFFNDSGDDQGSSEGDQSGDETGAETGDEAGADQFDAGAAESGDFGGDTGTDFGGDFGSDFGGGDFGGGEF